MILGTTFSHTYFRDHFRLPVRLAFQALLAWRFDLIRLGCYWQELEREKGVYDFTSIEELLQMADAAKQKIILTVGMKAPRYPEFHVPKWTNVHQILEEPQELFNYLETAAARLSKYHCIKYLQVENEPLDKSGPQKLTISMSVLEAEIRLLKKYFAQPIVLTLWGNKSLEDARLNMLTKLGDIVGIDLYYQIPDGAGGYWGPANSTIELKAIIKKSSKPIWITELQTNPWKASPDLTHTEIFDQAFIQAQQLEVEAILFWGWEYWYHLKQQGQSTIWNYIRKKVPTK